MFDAGFAMLFRAVDRIRTQLETADAEFRQVLAEELVCLQRLNDQYIDHWLALDEQIQELMDTYALAPDGESHSPAGSLSLGSAPSTVYAHAVAPVSAAAAAGPAASAADLCVPDVPESWLDSPAWAMDAAEAAAFRKGLGYFDLLMYDQAAEALQQAVERTGHPVARLYLAAAHAAKGRSEQALEELAAVRADTDDDLLLGAADGIEAELHWASAQFQRSLHCLRRLAERMPLSGDVWFNIGSCCLREGDVPAAVRAFEKAVQLNPADVDAIVQLAVALLRQGEVPAALEICREALSARPHHPGLLYAYALSCRSKGDLRRALAACRQALEVEPADGRAVALLAELLWQLDCPGDAAAALKRHLSLRPRHSQTLLHLGLSLLFSRDLRRAEQVLLAALASHPDKSLVWLALGRVSAAARNTAQAYLRFTRALKDSRRSVKCLALYYYGVCLYDEGRCAESEKYLKAALVLGEANPAVLIALGRVTERLGRRHEAEKLFARAGRAAAQPFTPAADRPPAPPH